MVLCCWAIFLHKCDKFGGQKRGIIIILSSFYYSEIKLCLASKMKLKKMKIYKGQPEGCSYMVVEIKRNKYIKVALISEIRFKTNWTDLG